VPIRIAALDRKLLRDLWDMKGQALAIAAVIGAGVVMFVAYSSNFSSLRVSQGIFYESSRFADVFATLKRAPARLEEPIRDIPGVEVVATRVVADVTIDVPGMAEPASGRLISALGVEEQRVNVILDFADPKDAWAALGDAYRVEVNRAVGSATRAEGADERAVPGRRAVGRLRGRWRPRAQDHRSGRPPGRAGGRGRVGRVRRRARNRTSR
jgi:putative ABC transport system permease protein